MADVENQHESSSFPVKRKSDLCCQDEANVANKAHKLNPPPSSADSESKEGVISGSELENLDSIGDEKIGAGSSVSPEKFVDSEAGKSCLTGDLGAEDEQEGGDEDEEEDEEEEDYSIEAEIDRKGKGISREDKGKGKLVEVDESDHEEDDSDDDDDDDDDEDDEDGGDEFDDSDLSDDPLAEVDLDNILPSRTRRRSIQPGVYISNDRGCNNNNNDDDDSSDDSDA